MEPSHFWSSSPPPRAGSLRHLCLYRDLTLSVRRPRQPLPASPPVTGGGKCGGKKSLFQSPRQPNPSLIFCFCVGGRLAFHIQDRGVTDGGNGRVTWAPRALPSTQGSRCPNGILRGCGSAIRNDEVARAMVRGRPPTPSVWVRPQHDCLCGSCYCLCLNELCPLFQPKF